MTVADHVLGMLFRFRRSSAESACVGAPCPQYFAQHRDRLERFVETGTPIRFLLPAFPAKSPNLTKVLGTLPDMAERVALQFLITLCEYVSHYHPPGAEVVLASDGHVFSDAVGVPDDTVTRYCAALDAMTAELGGHAISLFTLGCALPGPDFPTMRHTLEERYADSIDTVRERARSDRAAGALFNGIHRFLFEDHVARDPGASRSSLRNRAKTDAYTVIQRSSAWSSLLAERFPGAVRLSIHPQDSHSDRIGLHLMRTRDAWLTPWHGVALDDGDGIRLVRRSEAERIGASLVTRDGRPSHYVAPASVPAVPHLALPTVDRMEVSA